MTLLDLANFVCTKLNLLEPEDSDACKGFLKRRFDMIWADQLWKDALVEFTQLIDNTAYAPTSAWLPTKQILLAPTCISHVAAVRTDTRKLNIESSEFFYRQDFDTFTSTGQATQYRLLGPCVWELDTPAALYRENVAAADAALAVTVDVALRTTLSRVTAQAIGTADRIDAFRKPTSTGAVNLGTAYAGGLKIVQAGNFGLSWSINDNSAPQTADITIGQSTTIQVSVGDIIYFWFDQVAAGPGYAVTNANGVLTVTTVNAGDQTFTGIDTILVTLAKGDTSAPRRERIQILGALPLPTTIRVLGKLKAPTFTDDADEPALTGVENALMAFAQADMLQRERQYSKAQVVAQEAVALLDQLKKVQVTQQAHHQRLIPESGYGWEYQDNNSPLTF